MCLSAVSYHICCNLLEQSWQQPCMMLKLMLSASLCWCLRLLVYLFHWQHHHLFLHGGSQVSSKCSCPPHHAPLSAPFLTTHAAPLPLAKVVNFKWWVQDIYGHFVLPPSRLLCGNALLHFCTCLLGHAELKRVYRKRNKMCHKIALISLKH